MSINSHTEMDIIPQTLVYMLKLRTTINTLINGHVYQCAATVAPIQYAEVDCGQYPARIHRMEATTTELLDMDARLSNSPPNFPH